MSDFVTTRDYPKGRVVSYWAAHERVRRQRGDAASHACLHCGVSATQWAYDHSDPDEFLYAINGLYPMPFSLDTSRYVPLCKSCHAKFDGHGRRKAAPCA